MTGERTWLEGIKAKRRGRYLKSFLFVLLVETIYLGSIGIVVWAWVDVFHHFPPGWIVLSCISGLGSAVLMPLAAITPLAPMKGPDPEVIAADEFFKGQPPNER